MATKRKAAKPVRPSRTSTRTTAKQRLANALARAGRGDGPVRTFKTKGGRDTGVRFRNKRKGGKAMSPKLAKQLGIKYSKRGMAGRAYLPRGNEHSKK